jgi:hypothetical protein
MTDLLRFSDIWQGHLTPVAKGIEKISVVREFLDVFPDDLSGMPPERGFELQPDTAPIAKSSYRMTRDELAELKI